MDCRSRNVCLVSNELEVSKAIFSHRHDDLDVLVVQKGDEAIDLLQVLFGGDMAQIWSEEDVGQSELFKVLREAEVSRFALVLSSHFAVDMAGWPPFSEEIMGSLSRSILTLKTPKGPLGARFRALAERVETFA